MSSWMRRLSVCAAMLSTAVGYAGPAFAGPVQPRIMMGRILPVAGRAVRTSLPLHYAGLPMQYHLRTLQTAALKALPLIVPHAPVAVFPAFLPRLASIALLAPIGSARCADPRSPVLLAALPTTPFAPLVCGRDGLAGDARNWPALTPAHNKNALYGRAYSPRSDEGP